MMKVAKCVQLNRRKSIIAGADLGILRGGGGSGPEFFRGRGSRGQVRMNFHILTSKKISLTPPGSATA